MKVIYLDSAEFEQSLLHHRHVAPLNRHSDDWQDTQIELIEAFETALKIQFGDDLFEDDKVFVSSNIRPAKILQMDIYGTFLSTALVSEMIDFLRRNAPDYAIQLGRGDFSRLLFGERFRHSEI